jgi:hypothetical protein
LVFFGVLWFSSEYFGFPHPGSSWVIFFARGTNHVRICKYKVTVLVLRSL